MSTNEDLKSISTRFNKEAIEKGQLNVFDEILSPDFVNRSAPPGASSGPESMKQFLGHVLRAALPDLKVDILDQIAEGNKVTTRKTISGTHKGALMGVAPTNQFITIQVIDIVRIENGQYKEHWGINNLPVILEELRKRS